MMALTYVAGWKIIGLSTDTKPTNVPAGFVFYETDTGKRYIWNGTTWQEG